MGRLVLGIRSGERGFRADEQGLLEDLARQAGAAIHALRLRDDLARSHERLVFAREEERRRLRRDLHDGLGPTLAAIGMRAEASAETLDSDPATAHRLLEELGAEVRAALADIRRLVDGLRPPALDELGLLGAIEQQAGRLEGGGGPAAGTRIVVDRPAAPLPELPAAVEVAAFRIAVEALTNVIRHSGARTCQVRIRAGDDLTIEVDDDGRGLPPRPADGNRDGIHGGTGRRAWRDPGDRPASGRWRAGRRPAADPARVGIGGAVTDLEALTRVLIADDHASFRSGLRALLETAGDMAVVGEAGTGDEAVRMTTALQPDVVLMDLNMPGMDGLEATRRIVETTPHVAVLVVTMYDDDESVFDAVRAGARGYVLKGAQRVELLRAVRAVVAGEAIFGPGVARRLMAYFARPRPALTVAAFPELTEREREILELVARGRSNSEITAQLVLSPKTVRNHVSNIFSKLQARDRAEAIVRARQAGMGGEDGRRT